MSSGTYLKESQSRIGTGMRGRGRGGGYVQMPATRFGKPALVEKFKDLLLVVEFAPEDDRNLVPEVESFLCYLLFCINLCSINLFKD